MPFTSALAAVDSSADEELYAWHAKLECAHAQVRARRNLCRAADRTEGFVILDEGWACSYLSLPDGRRQILSFSMPGDFVVCSAPMQTHALFSIMALTNARYRRFSWRPALAGAERSPAIIRGIACALSREMTNGCELAADLGRRTAEERIARLLWNLHNRLQRHRSNDVAVSFIPLRQQHIADATGLTPVHVNRILGRFREAGILTLQHGRLTVMDRAGLIRLAS
jgi:CRP-like cAMP-binding protein